MNIMNSTHSPIQLHKISIIHKLHIQYTYINQTFFQIYIHVYMYVYNFNCNARQTYSHASVSVYSQRASAFGCCIYFLVYKKRRKKAVLRRLNTNDRIIYLHHALCTHESVSGGVLMTYFH